MMCHNIDKCIPQNQILSLEMMTCLAMQVGLEGTLEIADEGIYIHKQPSQFRQKTSVPTKKLLNQTFHTRDHSILEAKCILQHSKSLYAIC